ncbi:MAG: nucleotidyltransferase domain-containing protein [Desulfobacterales bacterium]|nr:nucleotidyltransferase domain-containing protein [Desulfobacterales bacterium]
MMFDYQKARQNLIKKKEEKQRRNLLLYEKACFDFLSILKTIVMNYSPEKVYQWGSLLYKEKFCDYSDIDIAIKGIESAEMFFRMVKDIEVLTNFPIDIVQWEKIEPEFRSLILLKGKLVYDRDSSRYSIA